MSMFKEKDKKGFRGGFNFLETYPLRFCNILETISTDNQSEIFEFHIPDQKVEHIIVNLCPTEPWALPNWVILGHKTNAFLNKLNEIRKRYFPEAKYHLATNKNESEQLIEIMKYAGNAEWMEVAALNPKYPQDDPVLLMKVILGIDIGFGQDTLTKGVLILDAQAVSALYENSVIGNRIDSRFIAISGTGLRENEIIKVQLGTSVKKVLEDRIREIDKHRIFINGPLRGREISDLSLKVDWSVNNIVVLKEQDSKVMFPMIKADKLVYTTNILGELRQCIYCNFCDGICPVDLEPALYYHSYIRGQKHKARFYDLERCIECGLCSFICPSKLELLRINKECKTLST